MIFSVIVANADIDSLTYFVIINKYFQGSICAAQQNLNIMG